MIEAYGARLSVRLYGLLAHLKGGGLLLLLLAKLKLSCSGATAEVTESVVRLPRLVVNAKGICSSKESCRAMQQVTKTRVDSSGPMET